MDVDPSSSQDERPSSIFQHSQSLYMGRSPIVTSPSVSPTGLSLTAFTSMTSLAVLGALGAAILLLLVFISLRRRGSFSQRSSILLIGPPDSGKTAIHSALVFQQVLPSHTTLQANASLINVSLPEKQKPRIMRLVDVPGHPRVRNQFKEYLPDAKAVVFVVDASTIARNGDAVAEHLHHVLHTLTSLPPSHNPPPLVILAHKSDLLSTSSVTSNASLAVSRVRTILERELERRRASQAGGVGVAQLGEKEDNDGELGGLECYGSGVNAFKFKDWEGGNVEILGSSVKDIRSIADSEKASDSDGLSGLNEFIQWMQALP